MTIERPTGSALPAPDRLAAMQRDAVERWQRARAAVEAASATAAASREMRMDLERRMEVLRAEHAVILDRTAHRLEQSAQVVQRAPRPRALVGHRHPWFTDRLVTDLLRRGVDVLGCFDNGAEVVGAAVAEQPDVVVVADRLAMLPGEDVVREVRTWSPQSIVVAQVAWSEDVVRMLDAGATSAYSRQVPPTDIARDLGRLLAQRLQDA